MKLDCPYLKEQMVGDEIYMWCNLVDKWCLLEGGCECEEYEEFLREVEE